MKKTFLSFITILTIILCFTACTAQTDFEGKTTFVNLNSSSGNYTITDGGVYSFSGKLTGGKIKVEASDNVTLLLSGVEIENAEDEAIKIDSTAITTIKVSDNSNNVVSGGTDAAINAKSDIIIEGGGNITINGTKKHGIECDGNITVKSGNITVNSYEHGIKSASVIRITDGNITINSETGKGIKAEKEYIGENGNIIINTPQNEGLESKGALTINGGNYDITAGEDGINAGTAETTDENTVTDGQSSSSDVQITSDQTSSDSISPEGESAKNNLNATPSENESTGADSSEDAQPDIPRPEGMFPTGGKGERTMNGEFPREKGEFQKGDRPMPPTDDYIFPRNDNRGSMHGGFGNVNADSVITINGGNIKINCLGDGIDSNGSLTINGGTIVIDGPENSENGPLDSDGEMIINGGSVLTSSSRGMTQLPRSMTQGIITVNFQSRLETGDIITISDENGNTVVEHTVGRICEAFMFTSHDIKYETEYTVSVNGEIFTTVSSGVNHMFGFGGRGSMKENEVLPSRQDSKMTSEQESQA